MKIILDAMGGDNAPAEILKGAAAAVAAYWPEVEIIAVGDAEKIAACARAHGFTDIVFADSLEEAVERCWEAAEPGDAVLLSPACASWGMFDNYEQRGRMFKEYVRRLKE